MLPSLRLPSQLRRPVIGPHTGPSVHAVQVDYRDRISVATWIIVFGLGTSLLLDVPTFVLSFTALGSPMSIPLGETTLAAFLMAVLAAAGAESVVAVHPRFVTMRESLTLTWVYWALPMAIVIIAVLLLPQTPNRLAQVVILLSSGVLVALAFFSLYATVEAGLPGYRRSRLLLDALAYGSALLLFLFVYRTRTRSLLSASLIAATATLLAVELLRASTNHAGLISSYGVIVGLILGQTTWALNYWLLSDLTGGLLLLLIFYLSIGIAQQGLQNRLNRRVLIEFGAFAAVALLLIAVVGPRLG